MKTAARYILITAVAAAWAFGAAHGNKPEATCGGDMECEEQCRAELMPDEDASVCDVDMGASK